MGEFTLSNFLDGGLYHIETSFYTSGTSVKKESTYGMKTVLSGKA